MCIRFGRCRPGEPCAPGAPGAPGRHQLTRLAVHVAREGWSVREEDGPVVCWYLDVDNIVGSRPDGWWRDRGRARHRLVQGQRRNFVQGPLI